jgi:hypothetical protein
MFNPKAWSTKEVIHSFKALKCTTSFIPGGTTGFVQVCDTVVNRSLKARIEELADQYIDENERANTQSVSDAFS